LGDARQAIEFLERAYAIMQKLGDVMNGAMLSFNLALLLTQEGRLREAEAHAKQAAQIFTQVGHSEYAARAQKLLAQIRSQKG
jgi:tetratricopeptide (TPR) repeat protein